MLIVIKFQKQLLSKQFCSYIVKVFNVNYDSV